MKSRAEISIATLCAGIALLIFWSAAALTPFHDWNGARVYPAYLLAAGQPIYPSATAGTITGWIYGPMLPLVLAPVSLISDLTWAMVAAGWINIAVFVAPLVWIIDGLLGKGLPPARRWTLVVLATTTLLLLPTASGRLVFITCDQLAIGLAAASCFMLHQAAEAEKGDRRRLVAATLAGLAIWTKQTEVLVPAAQIVFLWLHRSRREALHYAGLLVIVLGGMLGMAIACFGWSNLWFNLAWIPSHHPLATGARGLPGRLGWALIYAAPMIGAIGWAWRRGPQRETQDSSRAFARQVLYVGAALFLTGVLAAAKEGGEKNSFHFIFFFALAVVGAFGDSLRTRLVAARSPGIGLACALCAGMAL